MQSVRLEGDKIYLRSLTVEDATDEYVGWLNDPEVNQFLESRFENHTLGSVRAHIEKTTQTTTNIFLAILRKDTDNYIGNIKLGPMDMHHRVGSVGLMIGDKNSWGKGFATEAIQLMTEHAFDTLELHKVTAGVYANNVASIKAFFKLGFFEEGRLKRHIFFNGEYIDKVLLAKLNE